MFNMARGEGKAGCIIWLLIVGFLGLAGYRFVPAQVAAMELEDYMEELALRQDTARKPDEFFMKQIKGRADELRLPVKEENIKIKKSAKRVVMEVEFTVVIDLIVYEYPKQFQIHIDRQIFLT